MAWPDTLIAAAAAIGGGAIGAYEGLRQTRATLSSDSDLQDKQVRADRDRSREAREHQQLCDAYVPMMRYVSWAMRVNEVRTDVNERRMTAWHAVRPANIQDMTVAAAAAMRAAYDNNGPTDWEQEKIDAGPSPKYTFKILGLVNAFASEDVLDKFLQLVDGTERIEKALVNQDKAVTAYPGPLGHEASLSEVSAAARQQIDSAWNIFVAGQELLAATKQYSAVGASVRNTGRAELALIGSEVEPSRPDGADLPRTHLSRGGCHAPTKSAGRRLPDEATLPRIWRERKSRRAAG